MEPYTVVYEDENCLVVDKASGVLVHRNNHDERGLIDEIISDRGANHYLVHRIDKYTSGLVLIAKNRIFLESIQRMFLNNEVEKQYLAIVTKHLPAQRMRITLSLGRSKSSKLMFSNKNAKNYKPACTDVEVVDKLLVRLFLRTGRTHQIRAHMREIGCSILNDPVYGKELFDESFGQYLHAYKLQFVCPLTGKFVSVETPPPDKFLSKLDELGLCL